MAIAGAAMYIGFGLPGLYPIRAAAELTLVFWLVLSVVGKPEFFQPLRSLAQAYHDLLPRWPQQMLAPESRPKRKGSFSPLAQRRREPCRADLRSDSGVGLIPGVAGAERAITLEYWPLGR